MKRGDSCRLRHGTRVYIVRRVQAWGDGIRVLLKNRWYAPEALVKIITPRRTQDAKSK